MKYDMEYLYLFTSLDFSNFLRWAHYLLIYFIIHMIWSFIDYILFGDTLLYGKATLNVLFFIVVGWLLLRSKCWKRKANFFLKMFSFLILKGKKYPTNFQYVSENLENVFLRFVHFMMTKVCETGFGGYPLSSARSGKGVVLFCIVKSSKSIFPEYSDGSIWKGARGATSSGRWVHIFRWKVTSWGLENKHVQECRFGEKARRSKREVCPWNPVQGSVLGICTTYHSLLILHPLW